LHLAASEGHLDVVKILIFSGLQNINPFDRYGFTPYDDAVRGNFYEVAQLLK